MHIVPTRARAHARSYLSSRRGRGRHLLPPIDRLDSAERGGEIYLRARARDLADDDPVCL